MITLINNKGIRKDQISRGDVAKLRDLLDENVAYFTTFCINNKEDVRLYQGFTQALLAIKEAVSPKS